jgi:hypothetical protein
VAVLLPALKIALPYITQIVTSTLPMFTSRPGDAKLDEVVPQQIRELQTAATQNAESVKVLAAQLKEAIEGVDAGMAEMQKQLATMRRLAMAALALAGIASGVAIWAVRAVGAS